MRDLTAVLASLGNSPIHTRGDLLDLAEEMKLRQTIAIERIADALEELSGCVHYTEGSFRAFTAERS